MMICSVLVASGATNYNGTPELDVDSLWLTHHDAANRRAELIADDDNDPDRCYISCVPVGQPLEYFGQFFENEEDL